MLFINDYKDTYTGHHLFIFYTMKKSVRFAVPPAQVHIDALYDEAQYDDQDQYPLEQDSYVEQDLRENPYDRFSQRQYGGRDPRGDPYTESPEPQYESRTYGQFTQPQYENDHQYEYQSQYHEYNGYNRDQWNRFNENQDEYQEGFHREYTDYNRDRSNGIARHREEAEYRDSETAEQYQGYQEYEEYQPASDEPGAYTQEEYQIESEVRVRRTIHNEEPMDDTDNYENSSYGPQVQPQSTKNGNQKQSKQITQNGRNSGSWNFKYPTRHQKWSEPKAPELVKQFVRKRDGCYARLPYSSKCVHPAWGSVTRVNQHEIVSLPLPHPKSDKIKLPGKFVRKKDGCYTRTSEQGKCEYTSWARMSPVKPHEIIARPLRHPKGDKINVSGKFCININM